jgi:hypothetical protein
MSKSFSFVREKTRETGIIKDTQTTHQEGIRRVDTTCFDTKCDSFCLTKRVKHTYYQRKLFLGNLSHRIRQIMRNEWKNKQELERLTKDN